MQWRLLDLSAVLLSFVTFAGVEATQRTVRATAGWVKAPAEGASETTAFITVENGTMYDVYVVAVESDAAGLVELRQAAKAGGPPTVTKETTVPAFDRLDMSPEGVHIHLGQLKRPLKAGETVDLSITMDSGPPLSIAAVVK